MASSLFSIIVFPGFFFLVTFALAMEFFDRKLYARLQNRVGPPWFQPLADFIKLLGKEDIVPEEANPAIFKLMPVFALTAAVTASFYIPFWKPEALFSFNGDLVVVLYLLMIPTVTYFLGGWYSTSLYAKIGAVRAMTQLFAYEVPLFLSILSPALLADTWSLSAMAAFYTAHPWYWLFNILGFSISLVALLGKLEKVPFDIPEAETEIVAGAFTEYSGRLLGLFRLTIDVESVVGAALLAIVYLPFALTLAPALAIPVFLLKVVFIIALMAILRTLFARFRIDQMIDFCWRILAPAAFVQLVFNLIVKGALLR